MFGELGEAAVILGGEYPLFDAEFAKGDLQDFEIGDLVNHGRDGALVIVIVLGHVNSFLAEVLIGCSGPMAI